MGDTLDTLDTLDLATVSAFLFREARYADEHDYDAWEALWTDDARYWAPIGTSYEDPGTKMSIIYDNRRRIHTRMEQLRTGFRHAQSPPSRLRRLLANIEIIGAATHDGEAAASVAQPDSTGRGRAAGAADTIVAANFMIHERRERYAETWVGRATYKLRMVDGELKMAAKTVDLVNRDEPLSTISFIL